MNYWTIPWRLALLTILMIPSGDRSLAPIPAPDTAGSCVTYRSGDLIGEIESIIAQSPGPGVNGMLVPSTIQMETWGTLLEAVAQGELDTACAILAAGDFAYQLVHFTDVGYDAAEYLLLEEQVPAAAGWGTYVVADEPQSDLVLEVPHPGSEWRTQQEGVELLRQTRARALLVAGTDRCSNTTYSPCGGTTSVCGVEEPHRTSDVAHATQTIFFASHRALVPADSDTVAVQLHGCTDATCPDLFISNGTCQPGEIALELYAEAAAACAPLSVDIADCYPNECSLVGTTNVQGRYSNGIVTGAGFDACIQDATTPSSPEQFLHLEQSRALRENLGCLGIALRRTFLDLDRQYLPLVPKYPAHTTRMDLDPWDLVHRR